MPATDEAVAAAVSAVDAAEDVKASNPRMFDVADVLALVDVFVMVTAGSDRQLRAVADRIEQQLREQDRKPLHREGSAEAGWLLLDFGDVVCHLFSEEQRDFYSLERLWADVAELDPHSGAVVVPATPRPPAEPLDFEPNEEQ
ncbi:MAG: ribosome silencing factor [Nitriliruptoraceae bacterium]